MRRFEMSLEVLDAGTSAESWWAGYGDTLIAFAHEFGAQEWHVRSFGWGVAIELAFRTEKLWDAFLTAPGVQAILDAIPDPVNGLIIQRGWGGTSGTRFPRKPKPIVGSGAAELPVPTEEGALADAIGRAHEHEPNVLTRAAS